MSLRTPRHRSAWLALLAAMLVGAGSSPDATAPPPHDEFLVIPLRVHVLRSADLPEVNCALSDADVVRIVSKVNAIWGKAGLYWGLESIVREPAAQQDRFRLARDLNHPGPAPLGLFDVLRPEPSRRFDGLHVYYIHRFAVNGVYLGDDFAIVQETARLRPVEGGLDEPIPRVTSHELGHALGLPHRQDRTNLLASGTTGTTLNLDEVAKAREHARKVPGAATVATLRQDAERAEALGDLERARRLWSWLAEIPGRGDEEARRHLDSLTLR